ncbi:MAG: hypothetical protein RIC55_08220 [Pirellulaceae bacterium]
MAPFAIAIFVFVFALSLWMARESLPVATPWLMGIWGAILAFDVPICVLLEVCVGLRLVGLDPSDNLIEVDSDLDWTDVTFRIERELDVDVPVEFLRHWDGTFDSLVRYVADLREESSPSQQ